MPTENEKLITIHSENEFLKLAVMSVTYGFKPVEPAIKVSFMGPDNNLPSELHHYYCNEFIKIKDYEVVQKILLHLPGHEKFFDVIASAEKSYCELKGAYDMSNSSREYVEIMMKTRLSTETIILEYISLLPYEIKYKNFVVGMARFVVADKVRDQSGD